MLEPFAQIKNTGGRMHSVLKMKLVADVAVGS